MASENRSGPASKSASPRIRLTSSDSLHHAAVQTFSTRIRQGPVMFLRGEPGKHVVFPGPFVGIIMPASELREAGDFAPGAAFALPSQVRIPW